MLVAKDRKTEAPQNKMTFPKPHNKSVVVPLEELRPPDPNLVILLRNHT